jgi:PAS domain S-box-containing protein
LTFGILSLTFPGFHLTNDRVYALNRREWVRGLAALVLLFDVYTVYQNLQLQRTRRQLAERDRLFQLISENAADMIAVVDKDGNPFYNSPADQKILGYTPGDLAGSSQEQIHPEDRGRVHGAAEKARITGRGERLEYRILHKDGSWRVLESTASAIRGAKGETEGLVMVNRDITERKRAEEMLAHNAFRTASIGIAFNSSANSEAPDLLRGAEIAMYRAKQTGNAHCEVLDNAMHAGALRRLQLETDLRRAVDRGEFLVYYQPIVSLEDGRIVGFEALTRWQSPKGLVMPNDFIPVADETGIILSINRQLMNEACQQLLAWQKLFPSDTPLSLSVNISPKQFAQADLAALIGQLLQQSGMDPRFVDLEIRETIALADAESLPACSRN